MSLWQQLSDDPAEANLAFVYGGTVHAPLRCDHTASDVSAAVALVAAKAADVFYARWSFAALSEHGFHGFRFATSRFNDHPTFAREATALLRERLRQAGDPRWDGAVDGPLEWRCSDA